VEWYGCPPLRSAPLGFLLADRRGSQFDVHTIKIQIFKFRQSKSYGDIHTYIKINQRFCFRFFRDLLRNKKSSWEGFCIYMEISEAIVDIGLLLANQHQNKQKFRIEGNAL
jgi:hypothetical protein